MCIRDSVIRDSQLVLLTRIVVSHALRERERCVVAKPRTTTEGESLVEGVDSFIGHKDVEHHEGLDIDDVHRKCRQAEIVVGISDCSPKWVSAGAEGLSTNIRFTANLAVGGRIESRVAVARKPVGIHQPLDVINTTRESQRGRAALLNDSAGAVSYTHLDVYKRQVGQRSPGQLPVHDPVSLLVYATQGSDVRHVLVGGELLVRQGRCI